MEKRCSEGLSCTNFSRVCREQTDKCPGGKALVAAVTLHKYVRQISVSTHVTALWDPTPCSVVCMDASVG